MSVGIPVKLLHEANGHIVTVELVSGETYRGKLHDSEDNMNLQLTEVTATGRDGRISKLDQVFLRGSKVRFVIVPDMLRNAPMFKNVGAKGTTRGRGMLGKGSVRGGRGGPRGRGAAPGRR
eukprot:TRINITY_DN9671_c0_g4_i1.p1 TRINITY_DN9671_c0_g4~~TRINITY_DN9671_c0_g4_i1.p1  ORF type:complete len:121 (+),score=25.83 TRINITY_DN9671_c0_g4_i1:61-423(+)